MTEARAGSSQVLGPLDLLIIQPTPFCNIDCSYCYLPDRQLKKQISFETLAWIAKRTFSSGFVHKPFTVVWHAGEPLVLPVSFYQRAFAIFEEHNTIGASWRHSFQTNGTLITPEWCEFIRVNSVRIGLSIDGPAFLHDRCRKTRQGQGTHARVMNGVRLLREHDIPFHVITVVTRATLDYPDELYDFYVSNGINEVGFNCEEIEGPNQHSSLEGADAAALYRRFLERFFDLASQASPPLRVREFDEALLTILHGGRDADRMNHQSTPLAIISVDCTGNFSTFSPELLGLPSTEYGGFALGNVANDPFEKVVEQPRFQAMQRDIVLGIQRCRESCAYFPQCGGGAPGNKYFENGSFDSTETLFCRLNLQATLDVVLDRLERQPPKAAAIH